MNFEQLSLTSWLLLALFGIICVFFGYFWGKGSPRSGQLAVLKKSNENLHSELAACHRRLTDLMKTQISTKSPNKAETPIADGFFNADLAKQWMGKKVKRNDLKIIEGIGPKIETLFHSNTIDTWEALSNTSVKRCQEVLDTGGDRYRIHNPGSWPMQAKMAFEGKWKALAKWQEEHKSGKL